jgi:hypothetical protein
MVPPGLPSSTGRRGVGLAVPRRVSPAGLILNGAGAEAGVVEISVPMPLMRPDRSPCRASGRLGERQAHQRQISVSSEASPASSLGWPFNPHWRAPASDEARKVVGTRTDAQVGPPRLPIGRVSGWSGAGENGIPSPASYLVNPHEERPGNAGASSFLAGRRSGLPWTTWPSPRPISVRSESFSRPVALPLMDGNEAEAGPQRFRRQPVALEGRWPCRHPREIVKLLRSFGGPVIPTSNTFT